MTTLIELENVIRAHVELYSGRPTYLQNQVKSIPVASFCTIWLQPTRKLTNEVRIYNDDFTQMTTRAQSEFKCAISAWDGEEDADPRSVLQRVQASFATDRANFTIYAISGRSEMTEIQDLTTEFQGRRQPRAEFTYAGYANFEQTFEVDYFDRAAFSVNIPPAVTIGTDNPPPSQDMRNC